MKQWEPRQVEKSVITIRSVITFGMQALRRSVLASILVVVGLHSTAQSARRGEEVCIAKDIECTRKCEGSLEKLCLGWCDVKLKACIDKVPDRPDVRSGVNNTKPGLANTKFPGRGPVSGVLPKAHTNVGGNNKTLGSSSTSGVAKPGLGPKPMANPILGRNGTMVEGSGRH